MESITENLPDAQQFTVNIQKIIGGRFDLSLYSVKYTNLIVTLRRKFGENLRTLESISEPITSGATPLGSAYTEEGIPFLRVQNIDDDGSVDFSNCLFVTDKFADSIKRCAIEESDVLLVIVGATIGKSAIVKNPPPLVVTNQAIARIRVRKDASLYPEYVQAFLSSQAGQIQINALKRPVAQGNLSLTETGQILIPIIPFDTQQVIVEQIRHSRDEADRLRAEAKNLLFIARAGVDRMILAEEDVA